MVKVKEDMTGWKMWEHGILDSRLTVLSQTDDYIQKNGKHVAQWLCECNCEQHNHVIVDSRRLRSGKTKSCGCLQKEAASAIGKCHKKRNIYDLNIEDEHGIYGIGFCSNTGKKFYFDMDDFDKIKDYCWYEAKSKNYCRVKAYDKNSGKTILMHHIIADKYCDHADRNALNNRKYNLRKATTSENSRNCSLRINNKYGIIGVNWYKSRLKWVAYINANGKRKNLGYFTEKEDAVKARLEAEAKYFGEFAPQRHLFEQYKINEGVSDNDIPG